MVRKQEPPKFLCKPSASIFFSFYFGAADSANNNDRGILKRKGKLDSGSLSLIRKFM